MTPSDVLSKYAHDLHVAAPREFEAFVECFDAYATEITVAVTSAEQNEILVKQGRAQHALHLLKLLRNCDKPPKKPEPPPAQ